MREIPGSYQTRRTLGSVPNEHRDLRGAILAQAEAPAIRLSTLNSILVGQGSAYERLQPNAIPGSKMAVMALKSWAAQVLRFHALPASDAALVANCLVESNLRGVDSHGLVRLPTYIGRIRSGYLNPTPAIQVRETSLCSALVDGDDGMGFVVATRAMQEACDLSDKVGVGVVGVKRSSHFGASSHYVQQALDRERISLVFTNSSPAQPPWGGSTALLGAAPFAAGAPSREEHPFLLDMATTCTARGKLRLAAMKGEKIPFGLALDKDGNPTDDGFKAFEGVVMPFGGAKGASIAMLMEIISGVLSGSAYGGDVKALYADQSNADSAGAQDVGHFIMAMKPDLFLSSMDEYYNRFDDLVRRIKSQKPAVGHTRVMMPDDVWHLLVEEGERSGVPLESVLVRNKDSTITVA